MGKYTDRRKEVHIEKDHTKSPAWKGIGCVLMIVIPAISIAAAIVTMNSSLAAYLPPALLDYPKLPEFVSMLSYDVQALLFPITGIWGLYGIIFLGVVYMVIIGSLVSSIYALLFRTVGPGNKSPFDVERPNVRAKKYKR